MNEHITADQYSLTITEPVEVEILIRPRGVDKAVFRVKPDRPVSPGDTVSWRYPEHGIKVQLG